MALPGAGGKGVVARGRERKGELAGDGAEEERGKVGPEAGERMRGEVGGEV